MGKCNTAALPPEFRSCLRDDIHLQQSRKGAAGIVCYTSQNLLAEPIQEWPSGVGAHEVHAALGVCRSCPAVGKIPGCLHFTKVRTNLPHFILVFLFSPKCTFLTIENAHAHRTPWAPTQAGAFFFCGVQRWTRSCNHRHWCSSARFVNQDLL